MGNQQGVNQYQNYQPPGSQIRQQKFPYGNIPVSGNYQGTTGSVISNYYQQAQQPSQWPSLTNIQQQNQQLQQNNSNFKGSYINDPSIKGSQLSQRGSQINNNFNGVNYANNIHAVQYADQINLNPSFLNNRNNMNTFNNQQKLSNISQGSVPQQNLSQLPYNPSQINQTQSYLPSQIPQSKINSQLTNQLQQRIVSQISKNQNYSTSNLTQNNLSSNIMPDQSAISNPQRFPIASQLQRPVSRDGSSRIPSILQNKNQPSSILRTNRSSSKQRKIAFTDEVPRSVQLLKANIKLTKDKFDKLAGDNQSQLFGIMQQIDSEVNQGIPSKDRLIYLLNLKRNYEKMIIEIRMKQQKLAKSLSQINLNNQNTQIALILQDSNNKLLQMSNQFILNWRQILNSQNHPEFTRILSQGKNRPEVISIFEQYNNHVQAAISNLPPGTSTSSVMTIKNTIITPPSNYDYGGYTGSIIKPTNSMTYPLQQEHNTQISQTARFPNFNQPSENNINDNSSIASNITNNYNLNVVSASQLHNTPIFPLSPPSNNLRGSNLSSKLPQISTNQPIKVQIPKIADFLHSKVIQPPPQHQAFIPPLPTAGSFGK